jgi:hypothetical protein
MPDAVSASAVSLAEQIRHLHGPILVLGAGGFVGANPFPFMPNHHTESPEWS